MPGDRRRPFSIYIVQPPPPHFRTHGSSCHIILEQAPQENRRCVILTALMEGHLSDGIVQGAFSVEPTLNAASVIRYMDIAHMCANRRCIFVHERRIQQGDAWVAVTSGSSCYIRLSPPPTDVPETEDDPTDQLHFEDLMLMQTSNIAPEGCVFNPAAPEFLPSRPALATRPEHLQDLFHCWDASAFTWEEETRAAHLLTWFVAPGVGTTHCLYSRKVILFYNFDQWEDQIKSKWNDLVDPHAPVEIVVVQLHPPHLESAISAHVLVVQHPIPEWSSPLVTIYDPAVNNGHPFRLVVTVEGVADG